MSTKHREIEEHLPAELCELRSELESLPWVQRRKLIPLFEQLAERVRQQRRLVQAAQEAVDQLQFDIKFLRFDLEATRRERDSLRQETEDD